jgi:hypothetical protein
MLNSCVQVITSNDNNPPKANFSMNNDEGTTNTDFIFDGSFSIDDNDDIKTLNYFWEYYSIFGRLIDSSFGMIDTACFQDTGKFIISLTVFDSDSLSDTKDDTIQISQHTDPVLVIADSCINFGPVEIDFVITKTLQITNSGNDTLNIDAIYFTGITKNAFSCDFENKIFIMPDSTKKLMIYFAPTEIDDYQAEININCNDPNLPAKKICMTGQGFNDLYYIDFINIIEDSLGFGNVKVGVDSTYGIVLKNTGEDDREILAAYIVGEGRSAYNCDFSSEFIISPGEERVLDIRFSPQDTLLYSAMLVVKSDDEFSTKKEIKLTGKGFTTYPIIQLDNLDSDTLAFGNIEATFTSTFLIKLMNIGDEVLDISAVFVTGPDNENFHCDFNQSLSINPNETTTINIHFSPLLNKFYEAQLNIHSNDLLFPNKKIYLKGQGFTDLFYIELINIENDSLDFGEIKVGVDSTFSIILKNRDENDREILAAYIVEEGKNSFQCDFSSEFVINAGEERNINITFSPQDTLLYTALLVIKSDNEFSTKKEIVLTGKGNNSFPLIQFSNIENDTLNFGNIEKSYSTELPLEMLNVGNETVDISAIFITGSDNMSFHCDFDQNFILNPNESKILNIKFSPEVNKVYEALLRIHSSVGQEIKTLVLTGKGIQRELEIIYPVGNELSFGEVELGKDTTLFIEVENKGDDVITIEDSYIKLDYENVFSCDFVQEFEVSPGQKRQIAITFSPADTLNYYAELVIITDESILNKKTLQINGKGYNSLSFIIDHNSLDFRNVVIKTISTKSFNISNKGNNSLSIYSVYFSGSDINYFSTDFEPIVILPDQSSSINISFLPTDVNELGENSVHIANNSQNYPICNIELFGQGVYAQEISTVDTIDFGEVQLNEGKLEVLDINNVGQIIISDLSISIDSGDFIFQLDQPIDIGIGSSISADIYFNPASSAGEKNAILSITTRDYGLLKVVYLKGKALAN